MTLRVRHSGAWVLVPSGGLRIKESPDNPLLRMYTPDLWVSPSKLYVKLNGQWNDTGYTPATGQPGTPTVKSWSVDAPMSVEVQWSAPLTGVSPDSYNVAIYSQAGTKAAGLTVVPNAANSNLSAKFSNTLTPNLITPNTNYYVLVTAVAAGAASTVSDQLKIRTGHAKVTRTVTDYDWSAKEGAMRPTFDVQTSQYSDMGGADSVDPGNPADGYAAPWVNAWVSQGRAAQADLWEGLQYTMPNSGRLMTRVVLITEPTHSLYLGIKANGTWLGTATATKLGIPASILYHNYAASNLNHATNVREFDVEARGLTFSDIDNLAIAVTDFVNLYGKPAVPGTPGTAPQTTTTYRTIPAGYHMDISFSGKTIYLVKDGTTTDFLSPQYWGDPGIGIFNETPIPPASADWPSLGSGHARGYRLEYWGESDVRYRVTDNGVGLSGADAYLKYTNGAMIKVTRSIFSGNLGSITNTIPGTQGTPGSAAVPAWRARIQDLVVYYRDRVATGSHIETVTPQVDTDSGATAW